MSPDELRAAAERHYHCQSSERDVDVLIDAARRLADVIEYAEPFADKQFAGFAAMWDAHPEMVGVVRIARGGTTNHENRSE